VFSAGLVSTGGVGWFSAAAGDLVSPAGLAPPAGLASAAAGGSAGLALVFGPGFCADSETAGCAGLSGLASGAGVPAAVSAVAKVALKDITNSRAMAVEARNRSTRDSGIRDSPPSLYGANRLLGNDWPQFMAETDDAARCGAGILREQRVFVPQRRLPMGRSI